MRKLQTTAASLNVLFASTASRIPGNGDENNQLVPNSRKAISAFTLRWRLLIFPVVSILVLLAWPMRILSQTLDATWSAWWWQKPHMTTLGRYFEDNDSDDAYGDPTGWTSVPDVGWRPERCVPEATFTTCPGFEDFCQRIDYCGMYESGHFTSSASKASSLSATKYFSCRNTDLCETVTGKKGEWANTLPTETNVGQKSRYFWKSKSKNGTFTTPHWFYPEEIRFLLARGTSKDPGGAIAFVGDSLVRQLFNRMVFWMRGVEIAIDPKLQHDSFYYVDNEKDLFRIFPNDDYRRDLVLPPLVHSAQMFFLWEPVTKLVPEESQVIDLLRETGAKYLVLCSGAWDMPGGEAKYASWALKFLDRLATELPALSHIGLVASPVQSAQKRNALFENYALRRKGQPEPRFSFTKIGGIAKAKGSQGRIQVNRGDIHYQCIISQNLEHARGTEMMRSPPSGKCEDPLNLNINQLLLKKFFCCM